MPTVTILIVIWNGKADTLECLESLRRLNYPATEILIVDNASSDGSVACIQQQFPGVTILQNTQNLGFVEANNIGIRHALRSGSEYVLLLNNDTIVASNFLTVLVEIGERYADIGMLNPAIYYYQSENAWFFAGKIDWDNGVTHHLTSLQQCTPIPEEVSLITTDYVTGCALLVKSAVIKQIGLLDPRFFAYYEDTDWSVRCQQAGWKTVVVSEAQIWHKVSATAPSDLAFIWGHRNLILFLWKHSTFWQFPFRLRRAMYKCLHEFTWNQEKILGEAAMHGAWSALTRQFGKDYRTMPPWMLHFLERYKGCLLHIFGWETLRKDRR